MENNNSNSYINILAQSSYSVDKSILNIEEYLDSVKAMGQSAAGLSDNDMSSAYKFYNLALKKGIKPIIGLSLRVTFKGIGFEPDTVEDLVLYAKNDLGLKKLMNYQV